MVGAHLRRRAAAAALALFCAGFLSTCDFLTADIFPSWFSYVEARFDLESAATEFSSGSNPLQMIRVEFLRTVFGEELVAVLLIGTNNRRIVFLDPDDLGFLTNVDSTLFTPLLAASSDGNIACGTMYVIPNTFATLAGASTGITDSRQWLVRTGPSADQYVIGFDGGTDSVQRYKYSTAWMYVGSSTGTNWAAPYPISGWELVDSETDATGAGADFLFRWYGGTVGQGYVGHFASTVSIEADPRNFLTEASEVTGPFRMDESMAWITSEGPVAFVRSDKGSDRLVRYKFGTGTPSAVPAVYSEELDSIPVDDNDDFRVLSFDPSGQWWFAYDRRTGYLYKLRTWWK